MSLGYLIVSPLALRDFINIDSSKNRKLFLPKIRSSRGERNHCRFFPNTENIFSSKGLCSEHELAITH
jgi:hypothetical protein